MYGNNRTLGLSNCERYYAKGTRGINGILKIPALVPGRANDFLTKLFERYNAKSAAELEALAEQEEAYQKVMAEGRDIISQVSDAESANLMAKSMAKLKHVLTSKDEIGNEWLQKVAELGLTYNKKTKLYEDPAPQNVEA